MSDCHFLLEALKLIVTLLSETSTSLTARNTSASIYCDIRTVIDIMDLEPKSKAYVCCPKCFFLYPFDPDDPTTSYPEHCTHRDTPDSEPCNRRLRKDRRRNASHVAIPSREFLYQDMKQWVASLYARPDLKEYLCRDPSAAGSGSEETHDIWDAPGLQEFLGPDGRTPFVKVPSDEGRLVFSLNMDGFNPYRNRQGGKKVSVGGIYMICLNLPPSIRFNVENVYLVAIIPGPSQPSLHEINFLLKPLVDDLLDFWDPGVYLTRTHQHPDGLLVRCAVVPLVCDLPAARQMSGFAHFKSKHFCSECHQTLDDINDLEYDTWKPRTCSDHLDAAKMWRDAESWTQRATAAETNGVRWSELLRLPYWDPTRYTVIDSMHSFFLRLFLHHCRNIWGMNATMEDGDGISVDKYQTDEAEMRTAYRVLEAATKTGLKELRPAVLRQLCQELDLDFRGRKGLLINRLLQYVSWIPSVSAFADLHKIRKTTYKLISTKLHLRCRLRLLRPGAPITPLWTTFISMRAKPQSIS
jgi:Transposase family tnp2